MGDSDRGAPSPGNGPSQGRGSGLAGPGNGGADDGGFDKRLRAAQAKRRAREGSDKGDSGMGAGMRIAVELAAAVVVGTGIGIVLDRWWGTSPWMLIAFFVVGCAAGFLNVYRTAQELDRQAKERKAAGRGDRNGRG